ncbi:hypothetical protein EYF80_039962 [Liparis tanakae]|uniref:Uncharacterized protein n=1 Tax=Liparis tanakae TaxID=230148 RepID=A0A4Z2G8I0_9TELE|nr:hypothetical protein EYF80_039962 [Liparis tanakae]
MEREKRLGHKQKTTRRLLGGGASSPRQKLRPGDTTADPGRTRPSRRAAFGKSEKRREALLHQSHGLDGASL